jgi:hypothetical protein
MVCRKQYNQPQKITVTNAATPAQRLLTDYQIHYPSDRASQELTDSKADLLSWAGRDGRYNLVDLFFILEGHGETLSAWGDACNEAAHFQSIYDAEALVTWLGY